MADLATMGAKRLETPRRLEVRNGPGRRRGRSDAEKALLVAETLAPEVCIADVARRHGLHPQQLYTWRRQAKRGELILPAEATPMFAEVVTVPERAPAPEAEPANVAGRAEVVIEVGDLRLRIGPDVPPLRVAALVSALRATM
jgi:transposase